MRLSSDTVSSARSCQKIQELFEANGYRKQLVRRLQREVTRTPRGQTVNNERCERSQREGQERKAPDGYLTLPYIVENVCAKVNSIVKKIELNLQVAWRNSSTLRSCLTRSAFSQPQCPAGAKVCNTCESGLKGRCLTSGVVYRIKCVICESRGKDVAYIDKTKRPVRLRFNEHVLNAKNKTIEARTHRGPFHRGSPGVPICARRNTFICSLQKN